jgi:hypothetical protein
VLWGICDGILGWVAASGVREVICDVFLPGEIRRMGFGVALLSPSRATCSCLAMN